MANYLSPSIGQVLPQLDQACADLTRQALVQALTGYTKELCENDPELADILLEGTKSLPRCVRYITEQAQKAAAKQAEAMTSKEVGELPKTRVHGREIPMMGVAIADDQVFQWARDYYYGGSKVEPTNAMNAAPQRKAPVKNSKDKDKKKPDGTDKEKKTAPAAEKAESAKPEPAQDTQMSLFGNAA